MNTTINDLGLKPYQFIHQAMQDFTQYRHQETPDEIWFVEHPPVFTQGKTGKPEHLLSPNNIPIIQTDRGGQITYHGPGQQIMYTLFDLRRHKISIREMVTFLEQSVIHTLADYHIEAHSKAEAPGVYIEGKKICSLGLQIKRGCTLHGLALNLDMDLTPFQYINPCGYSGLQMTQLKAYLPSVDRPKIKEQLTHHFLKQFQNR